MQMNFPHLFLFILSFITLLPPPTLSDLAADRSALLRLRTAVRGRTLQWNPTGDPCSWKGVKCDNSTNRVTELRLPGDGLRGQIPLNSVGNLSDLRALSLRENSLSGEIPSELASCTQLTELYLQGNMFSGEIPASFFALRNLVRVNLARNNFSGNLSSGFRNLTRLRILYLENNQFEGSLVELQSLIGLRNFNVSFNELLSGRIPSSLGNFSAQSFMGTSLCGGNLVSCSDSGNDNLSSGAIAGIVVGSAVFLILFLVVSFIVSWRKYRSHKIIPNRTPMPPASPAATPIEQYDISSPTPLIISKDYNNHSNKKVSREIRREERFRNATVKIGASHDGLVFFGDDVELFSLEELLTASAEMVGKGTVGSTYKAYFESGVEVIVKRLKNVRLSEEDFRDKIEKVGSLVHENLEPLRGYYYGRDEKLLIFEPIAKGSLSALLHGNNKQPLSWNSRLKIALGTAYGIEYLHSISPETTHGNIKSSNIFLTDNYKARVAEYGLTQLVPSASKLNGYKAPEVTDSQKISQKADIYSFGVLIMELLSGKAPDNFLKQEGVELPNWVRSVVGETKWPNLRVFDRDLVMYENVEEKLVRLLHVAMSCTDQHLDRRPSMAEVNNSIEEITSW